MKIVNLEDHKPNKIRDAVDGLKRDMPAMLEFHAINAQLRRAAFLAYVKEGFTERQALELVARG